MRYSGGNNICFTSSYYKAVYNVLEKDDQTISYISNILLITHITNYQPTPHHLGSVSH